MINFRDPKDQAPGLVAVLGVLLIAGGGIGQLLFKPFSATRLTPQMLQKEAQLFTQYATAKEDLAKYEISVDSYRWTMRAQDIAPEALSTVNAAVKLNGLTLVNFRPQRATDSETLTQIPFSFTVNGPFAKVANMVGFLESGGSRLALHQVQLAALDGESDSVSANITLIAFAEKAKPESKSISKPAKTVILEGTSDVKAPVGKNNSGK